MIISVMISVMVSLDWVLPFSHIFNDPQVFYMLSPIKDHDEIVSEATRMISSPVKELKIPEVESAINYYFRDPLSIIFLDETPKLAVFNCATQSVQSGELDRCFTPLRSLASRPVFDLVRNLTTVGSDNYFSSFRTFNPLLYDTLHQFSYVSARISSRLVECHNLLYPGYQLNHLQWLNSAAEFGFNSIVVMNHLLKAGNASTLVSIDYALTLPSIIWPYSLPPLACFGELGNAKVTEFCRDYELLHDVSSRIVDLSTRLTRSEFFKLFKEFNPELSKDFQPLYFKSLSARLGFHLNLLASSVTSLTLSSNLYQDASGSDDYMGLIAAKAHGRNISLRLLQM
uniref:Orf341 n=1 Tax=Monoblepharella sp. JEL15 TaxID=224130 RepID=Q85MC6_9FUNG|nr:orf341 [Monoblepharella sp. JEL15]AAO64956.1 orf341 [Monoblepharella sp. JEL15]